MKKSIETLLKLGVGLHLTAEQAEATINDVMALKAERDALAAQVGELLRVLIQLNEQAERALDFDIGNYHALKGASCAADNAIATTPQQHLAEIRAEAVSEFLHILEHAPSSPVSAMTAMEVIQWWDKFKAAKRQGGAE